MSSREEFAALLRADPESGFQAPQSTHSSPPSKQSQKKPPQAPISILRNEQTPLLPPASPRQAAQPSPLVKKPAHIRSSSDFAWATSTSSSSADPSHPLLKSSNANANNNANAGLPPPHSHSSKRNHHNYGQHHNKPPLRAITTTPATAGVLGIPSLPLPPPKQHELKKPSHRRAKSDMPKSVSFGTSVITKSDLLKNFPDPRWGGAKAFQGHGHNRKRSGSSGGDLLLISNEGSNQQPHSRNNSGSALGYGSIASYSSSHDKSTGGMHVRTKSDMSFSSAVTDLTKSALVREITQEGRIRFQLPKDNFRILMDSSLETGNVYNRKLLDEEKVDSIFIEFHTEDTTPAPDCPCHCTCDRCHRCSSKTKALPPALFVMAVDSTLYKRMMDEVIESRAMPCGLFFCGHHEDVRYPDIKIAVAIVGVMFVTLILATEAFGGN